MAVGVSTKYVHKRLDGGRLGIYADRGAPARPTAGVDSVATDAFFWLQSLFAPCHHLAIDFLSTSLHAQLEVRGFACKVLAPYLQNL